MSHVHIFGKASETVVCVQLLALMDTDVVQPTQYGSCFFGDEVYKAK